MLDSDQTENLRKRLRNFRDNDPKKTDEQKESMSSLVKSLASILNFAIASLACWGTQHIILNRLGIQPFNYFETTLFLYTIHYLIKPFAKKG